MDRRMFLTMASIAGAGLSLGLPLTANAVATIRETRVLLGTFIEVTIADASPMRATDAMEASFSECIRLDDLLSRFRPSTAVSELNRAGCLFDSPEELTDVLRKAEQVHRLTRGAFNVTVQPVVDYLASRRNPSGVMNIDRKEFANVCALADASALHVNGRHISMAKSGMGITLDGIAKGYIADCMATILEAGGVTGFIVNAGGDIRTGGTKDGGMPWCIAVRDPTDHNGRLAVIATKNGAIATSGGYENAYDAERRHTHLVDPSSGKSPMAVTSVTVQAETAMEADALATAFSVMPPPAALRLADMVPGCSCLIVMHDGTRMTSRYWRA